MTERLYYTDAYATRFAARVVERSRAASHGILVLNRTLFYPTSGGQPHDLGTIAGLDVIGVYIRPRDGAVEHKVLGELPAGRSVTGEIDWMRRFDHMQQHSGQHVLSQAFIQLAEAETVGFHLGEEASTIDLARDDLTAAQIEEAESLANEIVWQNRPLRVHFVSAEAAQTLPLRKIPPVDQGTLRIVEVADFDWSACGGTHVAHAGEIGQIKITRLERRGQKLRLTFLCGARALSDYRRKNLLVNRLMGEFTTGQEELLPAVERLRAETTEWRRLVRRQQGELAALQATVLRQAAAATTPDGAKLIVHAFADVSPEYVGQIGAELTSQGRTIALLGLAGTGARLIFSRSDDAPGDMGQLLKAALQVLGSTAGGGTSAHAQGGGVAADVDRVRAALARAERVLLARAGGPTTRG